MILHDVPRTKKELRLHLDAPCVCGGAIRKEGLVKPQEEGDSLVSRSMSSSLRLTGQFIN